MTLQVRITVDYDSYIFSWFLLFPTLTSLRNAQQIPQTENVSRTIFYFLLDVYNHIFLCI